MNTATVRKASANDVAPRFGHQRPTTDYLAKDYESFRALMLDHVSRSLPGWAERHSADLAVTIVEILAYAADLLSYKQDAIADEAYLATAIRRESLRRHTRLVGYRMHEGCNARTLVHFDTTVAGVLLPAGTAVLTHMPATPPVIAPGELAHGSLRIGAFDEAVAVFETMHEVRLVREHNRMEVESIRPTTATLNGHFPLLRAGTFVLFCSAGDITAPGAICSAVRVTASSLGVTDGREVTDLAWDEEDRLVATDAARFAVANLALADAGRSISEALPVWTRERRSAQLRFGPQTSTGSDLAADSSLAGALRTDPRLALPAVALESPEGPWDVRQDLLSSGRFDRAFVAEIGNEGRATLRFGDGHYGRSPREGSTMTAHYRVGNGRSGNIRAHEIHHVVTNAVAAGGIRRVVNPFAAVGGIDPEDLEEVRLLAPTSALATAQRCVIADDYALVASEFPDVLAASATIFHGIGGRQQVRITVQPQPRVDFEQLCGRVVRRLEGLRLIGHDVSVSAPIYADVEIDLAVELSPPDSADSSGAQAAILRLKAVFDSADGSGGYFAPTMFTLGEPLRLADVLLTAQHVPGVRTARIDRLVVRGQLKQASALEVVAVGSDEIIRLVGSNDAQGRATIGVSIGCPL